MLQPAVAVAQHLGQEQVAIHGQLAEHRRVLGADGHEIGGEAREVRVLPAAHGHPVRYIADAEGDDVEPAHLHRMIDEVFIVIGPVAAETPALGTVRRETGRDPPIGAFGVRRRQQLDAAGLVVTAVHAQKQARAVEVAVGAVEVRRAHGQVPGIDLGADAKRRARRADPPGLFVELDQRHRAVRPLGGDADDVPREVPDHVAARDPRRQRQGQLAAAGVRNQQLHAKDVRRRARRGDEVGDEVGIGHGGSSALSVAVGSVAISCCGSGLETLLAAADAGVRSALNRDPIRSGPPTRT
jgi:hypothetical protein